MPTNSFETFDAVGLAEAIRNGAISSAEATQAAISTIEAKNTALNAVVIKDYERALDCARQLDETRRKDDASILRGGPFLIKDNNVFTNDLPTTFSASSLSQFRMPSASDIATKWDSAGLVTLGKTNLCEFALTFTTEPTSRGPTRNPFDLSVTPGGSSGGSAAAVASGMVPAAHANDAGGSIRIPASCCGLFGMKPTRSESSLLPYDGSGWFGLNHENVITRTVRDSAAFMDLHGGHKSKFSDVLLKTLKPQRILMIDRGLAGVRASHDVAESMLTMAETLTSLGHTIETGEFPQELNDLLPAIPLLAGVGVQRTINTYEAANSTIVDRDSFERLTRVLLDRVDSASAYDFAKAEQALPIARAALEAFFDQFDIIMTPTLAVPPLPLGVLASDSVDFDFDDLFERMIAFGPFTMPFNLSGQPAMSVPASHTPSGLPVGVQFAASYGRDEKLFALARDIETAAPWHSNYNFQ